MKFLVVFAILAMIVLSSCAPFKSSSEPATEQEANSALDGLNMDTINGQPMTPEQKQAFDKQMEEFHENIVKEMDNMKNQMVQGFDNMHKSGWSFNQ